MRRRRGPLFPFDTEADTKRSTRAFVSFLSASASPRRFAASAGSRTGATSGNATGQVRRVGPRRLRAHRPPANEERAGGDGERTKSRGSRRRRKATKSNKRDRSAIKGEWLRACARNTCRSISPRPLLGEIADTRELNERRTDSLNSTENRDGVFCRVAGRCCADGKATEYDRPQATRAINTTRQRWSTALTWWLAALLLGRMLAAQ